VNELSIFARSARRLIPLMMLLYLVNVLDRVNVGFAALTMNRDLGLSPTQFGVGAGIFFIGYFFFQLPANVMLERVGAKRWVAGILFTWGVLSSANAFIQGPLSFYALRFVLGVAECGFFPAMLLYLTFWFPQAYRARFTAYFMASIPLTFVIGSPLSGLILGLDGWNGLRGWQWLFLLEGMPACVLSLFVLKYLPDGPKDAPWLSEEEKRTIAAHLASDAKAAQHVRLWPALIDPRVFALGMVVFGVIMGYYGIGVWLPQIVQAMGFSNLATGFIVALPFVASVGVMIPWGRSSDLKNERIWHVAIPAFVAAAGFVVASLSGNYIVALVALSFAAAGLYSMPGPFWSLPTAFLGGTAAAGGLAVINAIGGLGGFFGPSIVGILKEATGGYGPGMAALALGPLTGAVIVLTLGRTMVARGASPRPAPVLSASPSTGE
jgi:ACS family tartrate transporter-like MFS transporter